MSYVRLGDYKKQQQTALTLYKVKPKNPYYFWAVMSIVMQATHGDKNLAKDVTLPLAERMVRITIILAMYILATYIITKNILYITNYEYVRS